MLIYDICQEWRRQWRDGAKKQGTWACGPNTYGFTPDGTAAGVDVVLAIDELEALRLVDLEQLSQAEAAERMGVARTTIAMICSRAHTKVADALVNGRRLVITGGNVAYDPAPQPDANAWSHKKENSMRIAVTYEDGKIFQHFGRTEQFKVYDVEGGKVVSSQVVGSNGAGHGALAGVLAAGGVDVLICGGIGGGAVNALAQTGIDIYPGAAGDCDDIVNAFLAGEVTQAEGATCGCGGHGHEHGHGHEGCGCGGHGHGHGEGHHCCH